MGRAYGFDTANYIYNVASAAAARFGTGTFYLRYLNPSPAADLMTSSSGVSEFRSGWDNGVRYFAPNTEPTQSRLNGTQAMGTADGQAFCAALLSVYDAVGPLFIGSSSRVDCYLSLEYSTNMSTAYWTGWATYVGEYAISGYGAPLYPAMYCAPNSPALNCSQTGGYFCYSVWSSTPEPCAACGTFGSVSWQAYNCYNSPGSIASTLVWQMAEQGVCQSCRGISYPNVDADMTNPNVTETANMMYLNSRP